MINFHSSTSIHQLSLILLLFSNCIYHCAFIALHLLHYFYHNTFIATIQGSAEQSCQTGVVLLSYKYNHTTPTPCVSLHFRAIQNYVNYTVQRLRMSYKVINYIWMLPLNSWWNSIPFLCKTKLWESNIDGFRSIIS